MRFTTLWEPGSLFHAASRYPRRADLPRVDRLAGILRNGLVAPACCPDGSVCSDLRLEVRGTDIPYDSLVFLHRFGPRSVLYTFAAPGRFFVFVDPALHVLTPESMGKTWVVLCQDEVYVRDRVAPESLIAIAMHRVEADTVVSELETDLDRVGIPLFDFEGNVVWQASR